MVSIVSLWLPILLSAVFVFVASSIVHMMLPIHKNDFRSVPSEDEAMAALRKFNIPPGDYMMPRAGSMEAMRSPEFKEKYKQGPVLMMTIFKPAPMDMTPSLIKWFIYLLVVGVLVAYVTSRAVGPGAGYLNAFRFAGTTAFIAYTVAQWQETIWYHRSLGTTIRNTIDGLVYALLTAGTFGWLWPK